MRINRKLASVVVTTFFSYPGAQIQPTNPQNSLKKPSERASVAMLGRQGSVALDGLRSYLLKA